LKRDPDLIRKILLTLESNQKPEEVMTAKRLKLDDWGEDEINYNLLLLLEAGYIKGNDSSSDNQTIVFVTRLTWEGHEFLDAARDDKRWEKAKSAVSKVGGWSFEVVKPILVELAKDAIKSSLGLPQT
jgi:hypothetical protein